MSNLIPRAEALWRALVEALDAGLLVLDTDGVVYANQSAESLLELHHFDLIGLDEADVLALFQPNRLGIERLATVLEQDLLGPRPVEAYRVVTQRRRLLASPFVIESEEGRFRCMLLEDDVAWRNEQISEKLARDIHAPLTFAANYSDALLNRLNNIRSDRRELIELAKVVRTGLEQAIEQWENLSALRDTDPQQYDESPNGEPVPLLEVLQVVVEHVKQYYAVPGINATLPANLPPILMTEQHLYDVLGSILQELTVRLEQSANILIRASRIADAVQIDFVLTGSKAHQQVRADLFDTLPLSTAEQLIILYGGRLWVENDANQMTTVSLTLPA